MWVEYDYEEAQTEDDVARRQLLALRYRLVSDDYRALTWQAGLLRLADTDSRIRQQAAGEVAVNWTVWSALDSVIAGAES